MWWTVAGIAGALGVALGAFGAHGLEGLVSDLRIETWQTASRYHLVHALALLAVAAHPRQPRPVGWLFVAGIILFSGSLYALVLAEAAGGQARWLGAITPLGGLAWMAAWCTLAFWPRGAS
jgi:uncharacterized membrane protein YgdD (TMEM256/DUF423 family)